MTLTQILADVYRRCGYASSPATDVATRITAFVNETHQEILEEPGLQGLLNDQITFTSVAAQAEFALPQAVQRIKVLRDTVNRRTLTPMSLSQYRGRYPNPATDSGTPEYWVDMGLSQVAKQPTVAGQLTVVSTNAADTTQTVSVQGFVSSATGHYPYTGIATLNGLTPVNIPGSTLSVRVTKFWVSAVTQGDVTLKDAAAVALGTVQSGTFYVVGETSPHYHIIALAPTPASAVLYTLDYERTVYDMAPSEEPMLPIQFHRLLAIGARAKEYEKQNQLQRMAVARAEYVMGIQNLKYWAFSQAVGSPNLRAHASRRSEGSAVNVTTS